MKKLLIKIVVMMMALLLVGCSTKTEYIYVKPQPYQFQTIDQPKVRNIRVHSKDIKLYNEYIKNFRKIIDFQNGQIKDYYESFTPPKEDKAK